MTDANQETKNENIVVEWITKKLNPLYWLGFTAKKATAREFVALLVLGLVFYAFLHWKIPPITSLSLNAEGARTEVLSEIIEQQKEINKQLKELPVVTISSTLTPTKTATPEIASSNGETTTLEVASSNGETTTETTTLEVTSSNGETTTQEASSSRDKIPVQRTRQDNLISLNLTQETIKKWSTELEPFFSERTETQDPIEDNLTKLENKNFDELNTEDVREIQTILTDLQKSLRGYELFCTDEKQWWESILWTNEKKWWEIIFWSLFGTLCYLIQQTSDYYLKKSSPEKSSSQDNSPQDNSPQESSPQDNSPQESSQKIIQSGQADTYLERYKPKYYYFLLRSPFYTLIILFVLSGANLDIVGISVSLGSLGTPVFVALAFILGFANRVTTEQLDLIIAAIFKDAWQRTVRKIDIYPSTLEINYGESFDFQVVPDVKVNWSLWSQPSVGTIDAATGMYIAPPEPGYIYNEKGELEKVSPYDAPKYRQVIIRAEREYEPKTSTLALVTLITDETKLKSSTELTETPEDTANTDTDSTQSNSEDSE